MEEQSIPITENEAILLTIRYDKDLDGVITFQEVNSILTY